MAVVFSADPESSRVAVDSDQIDVTAHQRRPRLPPGKPQQRPYPRGTAPPPTHSATASDLISLSVKDRLGYTGTVKSQGSRPHGDASP